MTGFQNDLIAILVLIPLGASILTIFLRGRVRLQRMFGAAALLCSFVASSTFLATLGGGSAVQYTVIGDWPAPFGIAIVFDGLSGILLCIIQLVALGCYLHSFSTLDRRLELGWFHPLFHLVIVGVNYSILTGDLFNLFVAFEIMLLASYALLCLGSTRRQVSQAYKYVILNLIGSSLFVLGAGVVYGMLGTLNYADLARIVAESRVTGQPLPTGFSLVSLMLLLVFALKAAVFPLWFWLPDTYHTMPTCIAALFAALLSKVGVYALLRLFPMIFMAPGVADEGPLFVILTAAAFATMVIAILGAIAVREIRRIISLVLISHVGFLVFGIVLMTPVSHAATLLYMAQEMFVIAALFLCCGMIEKHAGGDDLQKIGGLHRNSPWLAVTFFVAAMSLVGIPPLSGFHGKVLLIQEGFGARQWALTGAVLFSAVLTLVAMLKIWVHAFWMPLRTLHLPLHEGAILGGGPRLGFAFTGVWILVAGSLVFGFGAEPIIEFALDATDQLQRPARYVDAILGPGAWPEGGEAPSMIAGSENGTPLAEVEP